MNKPLIIKDSREHEGHGYDYPEDDTFAGTKIEKLSVGDYAVDGLQHLIFIDRKKTSSELANNISEARFEKLLQKASKYKYRYLLMEFDLEDIYQFPLNSGIPVRFFKRCKIKPAFLASYLARIAIDYDINLIFAGNAEQAEKFCYALLKRIYKTECLKEKS